MKWILLVGVLIGVANLTLASPLPRPPPLADPEAYFGDRESMDLLDRILGNVQDTASTTEKAELPKLIETTTSTTTTVPSTEGLEVSGNSQVILFLKILKIFINCRTSAINRVGDGREGGSS